MQNNFQSEGYIHCCSENHQEICMMGTVSNNISTSSNYFSHDTQDYYNHYTGIPNHQPITMKTEEQQSVLQKIEMRKLRNRESAKKSRLQRLERLKSLEIENAKLKKRIQQLESIVQRLGYSTRPAGI